MILSLISQLNSLPSSSPPLGPVVWVKNEFGDLAVDSQLAQQSNVSTAELTNGCVCCTLVGQLDATLLSSLTALHPSHLILETSGSSSPSTLALHLATLARTAPLHLSAIVCVIDALTFPLPSSPTSTSTASAFTTRMQARHTDLLLLNKWELASPEQLDRVIDEVTALNPSVPLLRTHEGRVPLPLLLTPPSTTTTTPAYDYGPPSIDPHWDEVGVLGVEVRGGWRRGEVEEWLRGLNRDEFFRVKGVVRLVGEGEGEGEEVSGVGKGWRHVGHEQGCECEEGEEEGEGEGVGEGGERGSWWVLNFAFGRWTWTRLRSDGRRGPSRLTLMGDRGIAQEFYMNKVRSGLHLKEGDRVYPVSALPTV